MNTCEIRVFCACVHEDRGHRFTACQFNGGRKVYGMHRALMHWMEVGSSRDSDKRIDGSEANPRM